jgi:hypothetical protein
MSADELLKITTCCASCARPLTLEEMHFYEAVSGQATCEPCELAWHEQVAVWRAGERPDYPAHPVLEG